MTQAFNPTPITHSPCPKCGSEDAKYLNVIYEAGLSNTSANTHYRSGTVSTTGTQQTVSSQRAAPPGKKSYRWCLITLFAGLLFCGGKMGVIGFPLLILSTYLGYTAFIFNSRVWPQRYQVWQQSAMCQRCGTIYIPNAAGITLDAISTKEVMAEHQRKLVVAAQPLLTRAQDLGGQVAQKAAQKADELRANAHSEGQEDLKQDSSLSPDQKDGGQP